MRVTVRYFLATLSVVTALALGQSRALACSNTGTWDGVFYYDGFDNTPGGTVGGVYSTFLTYSPYIANVYTNDYSEVYTSIQNGSNHASWGWQKVYNGSYDQLLQYEGYSSSNCSGGGFCASYWNTLTAGTTHTFTILYNNCASGKMSTQMDGITYETCSLALGWTPVKGSISGGINTYSNQMAGGTSNHETMTGSNIYYSGAWNAFGGSSSTNDSTDFKNSSSSSYDKAIWDNRCSS